MKNTRQKILDTSLDLFNQHGLFKVSQRMISKEVGMSPGNLTYHFKKKDGIIETLYFQWAAKQEASLQKMLNNGIGIAVLNDFLNEQFEHFLKYRFIFLDLIPLIRYNDSIKYHFSKISDLRKRSFSYMLQEMVTRDIMRQEKFDNEYEYLSNRMCVLSDFWLASGEKDYRTLNTTNKNRSKKMVLQDLYPYLTEKGERAFLALQEL